MPIQKNAGSSGKYIQDPGEYKVKIHEVKTGLSKKQKPMLTVVFETWDERTIAAYFVRSVSFHMVALEKLKIACGLKVTEAADGLVGKECGILVEAGEPDQVTGRCFMQIVGYGSVKDLSQGGEEMPAAGSDEVPF